MAAETTGKPRRQLFNSPAKGGADNGVRGAAGGAADGVPACAATSGGGLKEHLESRKKRGAWTAAEDVELRAYVAKFGAGNWKHVAEATALKRDAQSCRLRWSSHLDPKVNRAPFTPEEDARLLASVAWSSHGETKWAAIASAKFPSRTGYQIQSRWHSLVNKQRRWINEGKELPPCLEGAGTERGQGNTTTATDAAPVATPPGRSAGNTSPATVTLPPDAARGQSARKTAATDALAVVTGGTTAHATCPITPGTTASGAFSGAISVVASGNFPGLSSGCSSGVLPSVAPTVAASIAAGDSTDPSAVAAFILALQSAINGRPQPAGSGKNLEPSTPLNASVGAAATPSTTAAFILALQSAINSRPQSPSSGTQIDPSTPARVSLAAAAAAATSPLGASSVGATPAAAAAAAAAPSDVAAFIQALQSAINGRDLSSSSTTTLPYPTTHVDTPFRHSTTVQEATQPDSTVSKCSSVQLLLGSSDFTTSLKRPHTALLPPTTALLPPSTALPRPITAPATASPAAARELTLFPVTPQSACSKSDSDSQASGLSLALSLQPPTHSFNTHATATVSPTRLNNRVDADQSTLVGADMLVRSESGNGWIMKRAYNEAFVPEAAEAEADAADVAQGALRSMAQQGTAHMQGGMAQHGAGIREPNEVTLGCDDRIAKRVRTEAERMATVETPQGFSQDVQGMLSCQMTNGCAIPAIPRSSSGGSSTCSNAVACGGEDKEWNGMQMQGVEAGVLLEQRRRQQHAQEVQWEREKKLLLCGKQLRSEGREEGEGREGGREQRHYQQQRQQQHQHHQQQQRQQQQQQLHQQLALQVIAGLLLKHG